MYIHVYTCIYIYIHIKRFNVKAFNVKIILMKVYRIFITPPPHLQKQ